MPRTDHVRLAGFMDVVFLAGRVCCVSFHCRREHAAGCLIRGRMLVFQDVKLCNGNLPIAASSLKAAVVFVYPNF